MILRHTLPTRPYPLFPCPTHFLSCRPRQSSSVHLSRRQRNGPVRPFVAGVSRRASHPRTASQRDCDEQRQLQHSAQLRSEEHTSELQSLMRISYAVFCLTKKNNRMNIYYTTMRNNNKSYNFN